MAKYREILNREIKRHNNLQIAHNRVKYYYKRNRVGSWIRNRRKMRKRKKEKPFPSKSLYHFKCRASRIKIFHYVWLTHMSNRKLSDNKIRHKHNLFYPEHKIIKYKHIKTSRLS